MRRASGALYFEGSCLDTFVGAPRGSLLSQFECVHKVDGDDRVANI
jgi:hypothetical protein